MTELPIWVDAASLYEDLAFPPGTDVRPYVAVNMIGTADGKAVVAGGAARIGSPLDRLLMRRVRAAVDCVLVGAGTVRAEAFDVRVGPDLEAVRQARGLSPQPLAAIVTNTGDLPLGRRALLRPREPRTIVFTSERALRLYPDRFARVHQVATVLPVGAETTDLPQILWTLLHELGVRRLLVEGGPSLNQSLFTAGLVDELFLTIAPRVVGGRSRTVVEDDFEPRLDLARLDLLSAASSEGELFLRYRVSPRLR